MNYIIIPKQQKIVLLRAPFDQSKSKSNYKNEKR